LWGRDPESETIDAMQTVALTHAIGAGETFD